MLTPTELTPVHLCIWSSHQLRCTWGRAWLGQAYVGRVLGPSLQHPQDSQLSCMALEFWRSHFLHWVGLGWAQLVPRDRESLSQRSKLGFLSQWTRKLLVFGGGSKPESTQVRCLGFEGQAEWGLMLGFGYATEKCNSIKQNSYQTYIREGTECGVGSRLITKRFISRII